MSEPQGKHLSDTRIPHTHRVWPRVLLVMFLLLLVAAGLGGYVAKTMYNQAKEIKTHEQTAATLLNGFSGSVDMNSIDSISGKIPRAQTETRQANELAHGTLWKMAAKAPYIGDDVKTVQGMTSAVDGIVHDSVPQFIGVVIQLKSANLSEGDGQMNLQPILQAQEDIKKANTSMQDHVAAYHKLPAQTAKTSMVRDTYKSSGKSLDSMAQKVDELSKAFQVVPDFLGVNQEHHYAVMPMTTSEVRSGGGLVGSVGDLTTDNGKITIGAFRPNTVFEPYGAGKPTSSELAMFNQWGPETMSLDVRDLAVAPDTARTAEMMRVIWSKTPKGAKDPIDGVITIDPVFLQKLIGVNGDVKLSNGQVLNGQNTAEYLLNTIYRKYSPGQQDAIFGEVAVQTLGSTFSNMNFQKISQISGIMGDMARGRHFAMYSFDQGLEQKYMENGYSGQTPSSEENPEIGVYTNEQNVSKMSWYIHRNSKITRTSTNPTGARTYHVEYTMQNVLNLRDVYSVPPYVRGAYEGHIGYGIEKTLLYAPAGGSIGSISVSGGAAQFKAKELNGKSLYAAVVNVAPGSSVTIAFDVTTSEKTISDLDIDQSPMGWEDPGITKVNY
jgi:hypothetical protein